MPDSEELYNQGLEAFRQGDQVRSRALNEEALAIARANGDDLNHARALIGLCRVAFREQDHEKLVRLAEECRPIYDRLDDKLAVTSPVHMLAESCRMHGRFDEAREHYWNNIEEARGLGSETRARLEMTNLALLEAAVGNYDEAFKIAEPLLHEVGDEDDYERIYVLLALGASSAGSGDLEAARNHLRECTDLLEKNSIILDPADQPIYDEAVRVSGCRRTGN